MCFQGYFAVLTHETHSRRSHQSGQYNFELAYVKYYGTKVIETATHSLWGRGMPGAAVDGTSELAGPNLFSDPTMC